MKTTLLPILFLLLLPALAAAQAKWAAASLDRYNVVWTTPGGDSSGSMPLGNGDLGVNAWVEEGGDLVFYVGKTDAWNENGRLLKLGRIRVKLTPDPMTKDAPFVQMLRLRQGEMEVRMGQAILRLWVDANRPVIRVEVEGKRPFTAEARLEVWRTQARTLTGRELFSAYGLEGGPEPVIESPDTSAPPYEGGGRGEVLVWFHRNPSSVWEKTLRHQGMEAWAQTHPDPILHRTFGGAMSGTGMKAVNPTTLKSAAPTKRCLISVYALTLPNTTPEAWTRRLERLIARADATPIETARKAHRKWWAAFWNRSWIYVSGTVETDGITTAETQHGGGTEDITRGYALQRYVNACGGRGNSPIKFNGSIFTVDSREPDEVYDADYRRWGGPYWFQNTRLPYWAMLAAGDFEMMLPLFRMYRAALPFAEARTRLYFGHEGAYFPETMYFWGAWANSNYGWDRTGKPVSQVDNTYIRWYYSGALELLTLGLDRYRHTQDRTFLTETLLPLADAVLRFYDRHYPRENGRLVFRPAQALETWQNVVNPMPEIAGLRFVLDGLAEILTTDGLSSLVPRLSSLRRLRAELPPIPLKEENGRKMLAPAEKLLQGTSNSENPELYAVFPYRLYGVGKPGVETARRAWRQRLFKGREGWRQDEIHAACLGLAQEAARDLAARFSNKHAGSRFPAFWGPNYDWVPDQDHGCSGMIALQRMLLQAEGRRILLFPAWPKGWDVAFKLHAPYNTTVEGVYRDGRLQELKVTPAARRKDVVIQLKQAQP